MNSMLERVAAYNNAGAVCLEKGQPWMAWDLFRGALEVNLAIQSCDSQQQTEVKKTWESLVDANNHIQKAEQHLNNPNMDTMESPLLLQQQHRHPTNFFLDGLFSPYIVSRPFRIEIDPASLADWDGDQLGVSHSTAAVIIFNLAMMDHLYGSGQRQQQQQQVECGSSSNALSFYKLASSLLFMDENADINLGLAIINNIGCLCYQQENLESAKRCMEHLASMLQQRSTTTGFSPNTTVDTNNSKQNNSNTAHELELKRALSTNITWILSPPFATSFTSPAA